MNDTGATVSALPPPCERNWTWRIIQFVMQNIFTFWLQFRARGLEHLPPGGALFLVNHQSFIDPLLVAAALERPVSFVARDSLFRIPVIGWILRNTYVMPIKRESAGADSIREAVRRLQHGFYVGLFPEGTRTNDGQMGTIKPGFQLICRRANVPIIPVGLAGAYHAMPKGAWFLYPVPIRVVYGEPISAEQVSELCQRGRESEFVNLVGTRIADALKQASEWLDADTTGPRKM